MDAKCRDVNAIFRKFRFLNARGYDDKKLRTHKNNRNQQYSSRAFQKIKNYRNPFTEIGDRCYQNLSLSRGAPLSNSRERQQTSFVNSHVPFNIVTNLGNPHYRWPLYRRVSKLVSYTVFLRQVIQKTKVFFFLLFFNELVFFFLLFFKLRIYLFFFFFRLC